MRSLKLALLASAAVPLLAPLTAEAGILGRFRCRSACGYVSTECPVYVSTVCSPQTTAVAMVTRQMMLTVKKKVNGKIETRQVPFEAQAPADASPSVQNEIFELKKNLQEQLLNQGARDDVQDLNIDNKVDKPKS